ncbi:MAG: AAA family ATPase, partial [Deinococcus sp.]|nr:AAA family ATPase [Deinococcus sp.]
MAELSIYTLGGLRIQQGEAVVRVREQRAQALLAYLAVERRPHPREVLASLLVGEGVGDRKAREHLRHALWVLRRDLGAAAEQVVVDGDTLRLATATWTDVAEFETLASGRDPQGWPRAVALYQGPFLEGFYLPGTLDFEEWLQQTQERLRQQYTGLLHRLAEHGVARGALAEAQSWVRRRLEHDPLDESSHRQLMVLHYAGGDRRAALEQYETCRTLFDRELGVAPEPEMTALFECIRGQEDPLTLLRQVFHTAPLSPAPLALVPEPAPLPAGTVPALHSVTEDGTLRWAQAPEEQPAEVAPLRVLDARRHNLPVPLTRLIGREGEVAAVKRVLGITRLLTLTGAGGCGKTRLALQVAAELVETFANGVWLVELAALADPALVPQVVAAALGVREEPGRPLIETLTDSLRPKQLLLVLDNCEHLAVACAALATTLLRSCPGLRLLMTSREKLGIIGETTWRV